MPAADTTTLEIHALWDEEARVWVATSDDVPGLATEADTLEVLLEKLKAIIPELLALNRGFTDLIIPFHLVSERTEIARVS